MMSIINDAELLEDTAGIFENIGGMDYDMAKEWLEKNTWFMEKVVNEMWVAQENYIAEHMPKVIEGEYDE